MLITASPYFPSAWPDLNYLTSGRAEQCVVAVGFEYLIYASVIRGPLFRVSEDS